MKSESAHHHTKEPVAIVGIGCRFPGGIRCPRTFWKFLCEGGNGITEVPPDRWDIDSFYDENREKPGKIYTRKGGFLDNVDSFDPDFFGISARYCPWTRSSGSFEVAGRRSRTAAVPESLKRSKVGVFIGPFMHDSRTSTPESPSASFSALATGSRRPFREPAVILFRFHGAEHHCHTAARHLSAVHLACRSILTGSRISPSREAPICSSA